MTDKGPQKKRSPAASPQPAEVMGVGLQFAAAILFFLFLGRWLDDRLGTAPWLLILGVMVGAGGGFYSMYRRLVVVPRERGDKERDQ